ncbi:hypothetical protein ABID30_000754 [Enterococcus rotai]|uniref:ABC-2 type transporter transmembrane domain-containing protein n=1 Tax=Enterococcus rotai TaxID=118060 RepID=A0A0U2VEF4_9ENTE|nr:ABC transporter permease [Enterococcus rotai]ALS36076.1 hypothetical protein ATZ35_02535 [Enterococcus rotai]
MTFLNLVIFNLKYFTNFKNKFFQFLFFFQPLFNLTTFYFLAKLGVKRFEPIHIIVTAVTGMITFSLYSTGSYLYIEDRDDTLKLNMFSSTNIFIIALSKATANSIVGLIIFFVSFFYGAFIFKVEFYNNNIGLLIIILIVLLVVLTAIGLLFTSIVSNSPNIYTVQNILVTPIILASGIYPLENFKIFSIFKLINPLHPLIYCLYNTPDIQYTTLIFNIGHAILISGLYLLLSYVLIKKFIMRGTRQK